MSEERRPQIKERRALPYGPKKEQRLDFFPAFGDSLHRAVAFIHGGGWTEGSYRSGVHLSGVLNGAGYTLVSIGYRQPPSVTPSGSAADVARAIAVMLQRGEKRGLTVSSFALIGHSSGGHLAALIGTDPSYLESAGVDPRRLAAIIALDGVFDVRGTLNGNAARQRSELFGDDPEQWAAMSPTAQVGRMKHKPLYGVAYGDVDPRFPWQARLFESALNSAGERVRSIMAPGVSHRDLYVRFGNSSLPMGRFTVECLREAFAEEEATRARAGKVTPTVPA